MRRVSIAFVFVVTAAIISVFYHLTQQADINYYQGHRMFLAGKYRPAIPFFQTALEEDPGKKEAILELGYSYLWTGSPKKAIPLLLVSSKNYPKDKKIMCGLADAYSWNKKYDEAIAILRNKLLVSDDILIKKKLAEVYLWSGRNDLAEIILESILRRNPGDTDALYMLGKALYYSGESRKASEILEKLLKEMNNG
jgi:tetratricopeptide (TPR) repeat protein